MDIDARVNDITRRTIGAAIEVHRTLGPGLLESIYSACLQVELDSRELRFAAQQPIPVTYKGVPLNAHYRIDLIVEQCVVVEIKCVEALTPVHEAQVLTYLRLTGCPLALLINFNVPRLVDGIQRLIETRSRADRSKKAESDQPQRRRGTEEHRDDEGSTGRPAVQAGLRGCARRFATPVEP